MPENNKAGESQEHERDDARAQAFARARLMGAMALHLGRVGAVRGIRAVIPILEGYAPIEERPPDELAKRALETEDPNHFSERERQVLRAAGTKLTFEAIELASLTDPVASEGEPYLAQRDPDTGRYPPPKLAHLLSLGMAAQRLWPEGEAEKAGETDLRVVDQVQRDTVDVQPIVLAAAAPGRHIIYEEPVPAIHIQRAAMMNQYYGTGRSDVGAARHYSTAGSGPGTTRSSSSAIVASRSAASTKAPVANGHTHGCRCGGGGASQPMARYDEDGSCASLFTVSCESRWRLRNCLRTVICDMLYCLGQHICEDGTLKEEIELGDALGDCLKAGLCSLVQCVPDALCGPRGPEKVETPCHSPCDFAVEEWQ